MVDGAAGGGGGGELEEVATADGLAGVGLEARAPATVGRSVLTILPESSTQTTA